MYLALLNENQKKLFLGLAYNLASMDGDYSEQEKQMIDSYCMEMHIEFNDSIVDKEVNNIVNEMNETCNEQLKRVIIFESIGLAMSDGKYDEKEKDFIVMMTKTFGIDSNFVEHSEKLLTEFIKIQLNINNLVI